MTEKMLRFFESNRMDALFSLFHKPHARVQIPIEADLFPLNLNIQLDQYVSWVHGPNFIKVYAFKLKKKQLFYILPPIPPGGATISNLTRIVLVGS